MSYGNNSEEASTDADAQLVERVQRLVAEFYRINPHLEPLPVTVIPRKGTVLEVSGDAHDR